MPSLSPAIAIVGPTASGKSDLALRIAQCFGGEIINFDSVQVYRLFDIGTAKTPVGERLGIPHHLIDHVDPDQDYSAGEFARDAKAVLSNMRRRGVLPVLAGGTGFYLEALLNGLSPSPQRNPALRARLRRTAKSRPDKYLWRILSKLDRAAAKAIHPRDEQKLIRAIEICLLGKRPRTEQWRAAGQRLRGYRMLTLGLEPPRQELYSRINERARGMFNGGLPDEIRALLRNSVPRAARPFGALGYRQCVQHLDGECTLDDAIESTALHTRRYAKRQLTWFRHRTPDIRWLKGFGGAHDTWIWAREEVRAWLGPPGDRRDE